MTNTDATTSATIREMLDDFKHETIIENFMRNT